MTLLTICGYGAFSVWVAFWLVAHENLKLQTMNQDSIYPYEVIAYTVCFAYPLISDSNAAIVWTLPAIIISPIIVVLLEKASGGLALNSADADILETAKEFLIAVISFFFVFIFFKLIFLLPAVHDTVDYNELSKLGKKVEVGFYLLLLLTPFAAIIIFVSKPIENLLPAKSKHHFTKFADKVIRHICDMPGHIFALSTAYFALLLCAQFFSDKGKVSILGKLLLIVFLFVMGVFTNYVMKMLITFKELSRLAVLSFIFSSAYVLMFLKRLP